MSYKTEIITPFVGTDSFRLGEDITAIRTRLKEAKIKYTQRVESNKGCQPEVPWTFLEVDNCVTLCFVKDILFEIVFGKGYQGKLANGAFIGMKMSELVKLDNSVFYNEDDEDYISKQGYWVVDELDTNCVEEITVFLPEVEQPDFFEYSWIVKYSK